MKTLCIILGSISLALGILGIFLPLLPTTPFLLLTAALYFKGSPLFTVVCDTLDIVSFAVVNNSDFRGLHFVDFSGVQHFERNIVLGVYLRRLVVFFSRCNYGRTPRLYYRFPFFQLIPYAVRLRDKLLDLYSFAESSHDSPPQT